jgi:hypothetical protein
MLIGESPIRFTSSAAASVTPPSVSTIEPDLAQAQRLAEHEGGEDDADHRHQQHAGRDRRRRQAVSQLERGDKTPSGPALVLLNVIRRKGIEAIF